MSRCHFVAVVAVLCGFGMQAAPAECAPPHWKYGPGQGYSGVWGWLSFVPGVSAMTTWDPDGPAPMTERLVIGGDFRFAGNQDSICIAAWDGANWHAMGIDPNASFSAGTYGVRALTVFQGAVIAAGDFYYGGQGGPIRWNGTTWESMGANFQYSDIVTLAEFNGQLYAGGRMMIGGVNVPLARYDGSQWVAVSGAGNDPVVRSLLVHDGALYVGGEFTALDGVACTNVARFDGTTWAPLPTNPQYPAPPIGKLAMLSGRLIASHATAGVIVQYLNSSWSPVSGGPLGAGTAIHVLDGWLYRVGYADTGRWNGEVWETVPLRPFPDARELWSFRGELIAGGPQGTYNEEEDQFLGVARWNGSEWKPLGNGLGAHRLMQDQQRVNALLEHQGDLIAGGFFQYAGAEPTGGIATWDGKEWRPIGLRTTYGNIEALAVFRDQLIAGGSVASTDPNGTLMAARVARWNGVSWQPVGGDVNNVVHALAVYDDELIAGGSFTIAGGMPATHIAAWNGSSWRALGPGLASDVRALLVHNGELIAGGWPQSGQGSYFVAAWDGTQWCPIDPPSGAASWSMVESLASYGGDLIIGSSSPLFAARWDGVQTTSMAAGTLPHDDFLGFTIHRGALYATGDFGGTDRSVLRWNGAAWEAFGAGFTRPPDGGGADTWPGIGRAIATHRGDLVVGGTLTRAGGRISRAWARWGYDFHDLNADGDIDAADFAALEGFLTSPGVVDWTTCPCADSDADGDIDLADVSRFQSAFGEAS